MHGQRGAALALGIAHGHGHGDHAAHEFLAVAGVAFAHDARAFIGQRLGRGQRVGRAGGEFHAVQNGGAPGRRHMGQEQLAAGRGVDGHHRSGLQLDAQRPVGFDTVQVAHARAVQHGEVAGLAQTGHQLGQQLMAQGLARVGLQGAHGKAQQLGARGEAAVTPHGAAAIAAPPGGSTGARPCLGQVERGCDVHEARRGLGLGHEIEHGQGAIGDRVRFVLPCRGWVRGSAGKGWRHGAVSCRVEGRKRFPIMPDRQEAARVCAGLPVHGGNE